MKWNKTNAILEGFPFCCGIDIICDLYDERNHDGYYAEDCGSLETLVHEYGPNKCLMIAINHKQKESAEGKKKNSTMTKEIKHFQFKQIAKFRNRNTGNMVYVYIRPPKKVKGKKSAALVQQEREHDGW